MPHNILFLQQFTKELIINSTPKEFLRKLELQDINKKEQVKEELKSEMLQEKIEIKPDIPSIVHQLPTIPIPRRQNVKSMQIPSPLLKTNNQFSNYQGLELGKITPIIVNQGVISIECPGPGKLISVRSIGRATPTKMMLNKEEINSIIIFFPQFIKSGIVIKTRKVGKSDYYKLNLDNSFVKNLIKLDWSLTKRNILPEIESKEKVYA